MLFDLVCRSCGAYRQRWWDPTQAVTATPCDACRQGMSVIGIDFAARRQPAALEAVLQVMQQAGIVPLAIDRPGRSPRRMIPTLAAARGDGRPLKKEPAGPVTRRRSKPNVASP